jgi:hypothetical protein
VNARTQRDDLEALSRRFWHSFWFRLSLGLARFGCHVAVTLDLVVGTTLTYRFGLITFQMSDPFMISI